MRFVVIIIFLFSTMLCASYLNNHSCNECHEKIYQEYQSSAHSKTFFNDELHRKIANKVSAKKYDCAVCHMPAADNLHDLMVGKARPDKNNVTHTDAVSCYFCHTIAYVKKAHKYNLIQKARQAENFKPTLYGRLTNPEDSDKHSSLKSPIYGKMACIGCHAHKLNDKNTTIFQVMNDKEDSLSCIKCHMPQLEGGVEKMDKRNRGHHISHKFLGIHDIEFRKKGVDINASVQGTTLKVVLHNKMTHPLIIQPARVKYLSIKVYRKDNLIWQNYKKSPKEDKQSYFTYIFKQNNHTVIIPHKATQRFEYNLNAKETKILKYNIPDIQKGDKVEISLYVELAKADCVNEIDLKDTKLIKPQIIKKISFIFN